MNTAIIATGTTASAPDRPIRPATLAERFLRRAGRALAWSRGGKLRYSRDDLAELHERRLEAERLRQERFSELAVTRLL